MEEKYDYSDLLCEIEEKLEKAYQEKDLEKYEKLFKELEKMHFNWFYESFHMDLQRLRNEKDSK